MTILSSYTDVQFCNLCNFAQIHTSTNSHIRVGLRGGCAYVTRRLDSWGFLKIVHFQEGYESGSRDA